MSGQLTAIAREFGFPSTSGICIYLHLADNGLQFTPRVSDESWSLLWGHILEDRQGANQSSGLPIAGRIEFDLDLRKARWFDMWVSTCRREVNGPSPPQSLAADHRHHREESRTTTDFLPDSLAEDASMHIQRKVPVVRHIPRKLSLLDRIDIAPIKISSQPASRIALSPTDGEQIPMPIPIVHAHEEETPRAMSRVDDKVETWRASSSFAKSPFANSQTALDPANLPNNMPIPDAIVDAEEELPLNFEDFQWSISSAGPPSTGVFIDSPLEWHRPPSVHLDGRAEGSVCLTPTTCTSFGPPDYDYLEYASSLISRLPSPDVASRAISNCPPTPTTVTSWGPPSEWPGSPAESFRAPSVDIAARYMDSRPATPGTATSWGAPLDWPVSPAARPHVMTPGVGHMFFDDDHEEEGLLGPKRIANEAAQAWRHVWPYTHMSHAPRRLPVVATPSTSWNMTQPNSKSSEPGKPVSTRVDTGYPNIIICTRCFTSLKANVIDFDWSDPSVYPNFELYPAKPLAIGLSRDVDVVLKPTYPTFSICMSPFCYADLILTGGCRSSNLPNF